MLVDSRHPTAVALATPTPWKKLIGVAGGVVLGAVLLVAAWAKLLDPLAFVEQIRVEGLDFLLPATAVAYGALALEVGLGVALVLGVRRLPVLVPAALLVAFFLALTGRAWWLDAHGLREAADCGCFGKLVERTPAEAFWQDALLLMPALLLAFVGRPRVARYRARVAAAVLAALVAVGFAHQAPALPLDDLATRLRPGVALDEICSGRGEARLCLSAVVPELTRGAHWVVLADLSDDAFGETVPRLNDYALSGASPPLTVVAAASLEEQTAFFWSHGPAFEIREAPASLLAPLYRRLPRSFTVEDGEVTATFSGLPPLDASNG